MFYLVDKKDELVRQSESRMALRRIRRKSTKPESLRIIEGDTLKKALAVKVEVKVATKKEEKIDKKQVKKAIAKHAKKVQSEDESVSKKEARKTRRDKSKSKKVKVAKELPERLSSK